MWSHAQVCLAFLIAAIFTKPVTAGLASYTVYLVSAAGAPFFLYLADTRTGALPTVSAIYPPLGFISTLNILFLGRSSLEFSRQLGISYASSTALGLLGVFIHAGRGTSGGDLSARNLFSWLPGVNMVAPFVQPDTNVDEDVLDEETSVLAREREHPGKMENDEAIRLVEVKKSYGAKQAVKGVTFSIRYGESFGLLGPNGAGKTTTLSMITGLLRPTSGTIYVAGQRMEDFGINTGRVVGTCPQFDRVWSSMTIEEHLQFYSRLRGIPAKHLKSRVRRIAEEVGLDGDPFQMMADHLSGGMKRRLSIGIALTGSPAILVCDEPSTGLDPETRRQVWKVLSSVKGSNRCLIVTTHAMEEADAICNRIGIVSNGKMRVIGTQNRLKQKFGSGLKISLRFEITHSLPYKSTKEAEEISQLQSIENKRVEEVNAGVLSFLTPEAVLLFRAENDLRNVRLSAKLDPFLSGELQRVMTWSVLLRYGLPQGNVIDIFGKISQFCDSHDIADWELNQTTLDDVFVRVNEQYGGDR
ncbi:P-loop containing nucleoside triphosphate hydrolase protein [Cladochytrium replicatum]|nr:P-loop containing nucleoside triphosphate hydrolase protein [Cladochytrium replicatum]